MEGITGDPVTLLPAASRGTGFCSPIFLLFHFFFCFICICGEVNRSVLHVVPNDWHVVKMLPLSLVILLVLLCFGSRSGAAVIV